MKDILIDRLKNQLPGLSSQQKMSIFVNGKPIRSFTPKESSKSSSVMLLLCNINDKPEILFTLRSEKLKSHSGQISFPGGRVEIGESEIDAALRETNEEIGVEKRQIEVIGKLSTLYVPPSDSIIHPFVGILEDNYSLMISEIEVEEAFFIPLEFFKNKENLRYEKWNREGLILDVPLWDVGKKVPLWGATAMILNEFLELIQ